MLKEQKRALLKSPERKIGQVLLAPYRLPERLVKIIWKKLFRQSRREDTSASSEYHKWIERHRANVHDLGRMRQEALGFAFQPLISIITPVFNTPARWLRECVGSVLSQTYNNWELILIDDHSNEADTLRSLTELAASDSRIILAKDETRGGISAASNRGLALARGDWVALLDHDDLLEPMTTRFSNCEIGFKTIADAMRIHSEPDEERLRERRPHFPMNSGTGTPNQSSCNFIVLHISR